MKARRLALALRRLAGPAILAFGAALLCLAGAARAESGAATDAAFGALLAMPGAQPRDGGWVIPQEPAKSEADLIARLRQLKKEGANFNAVRHRGTLLAHAIRAGKEEAAIWLLRNGADPAHLRLSQADNAYDLAVRYKRTRVADVLEHQYGFKPRPPVIPKAVASTPAATPASASPAPASREQAAKELIARLASQPVPDEASQRQWRAFAATLSQDEYRAVFRNGEHIESLVRLTRNVDGALEEALSRLPRDVVRQKAQDIANLLMQFSFFSYRHEPGERPLDSSISWPALWKRIDQPLRYDTEPDLAGRVSPALWPGLFASG